MLMIMWNTLLNFAHLSMDSVALRITDSQPTTSIYPTPQIASQTRKALSKTLKQVDILKLKIKAVGKLKIIVSVKQTKGLIHPLIIV